MRAWRFDLEPWTGCLPLLLLLAVTDGVPALAQHKTPDRAEGAIREGQRVSRQADQLVKDRREQEAADLYLTAHQTYQAVILDLFEESLRAGLGGSGANEEQLMRAGWVATDLRNVNLSKLWIVLDPDDRAHEQALEAERAALIARFSTFVSPASAGPLEEFLHRLYPEDRDGTRQMEAFRDGRLPPSKRWARLYGFER